MLSLSREAARQINILFSLKYRGCSGIAEASRTKYPEAFFGLVCRPQGRLVFCPVGGVCIAAAGSSLTQLLKNR